MTLFEMVDKIAAKWAQLEHKLKGPDFKEEGCELSIKENRIVYKGRPIAEATLADKIEATKYVETLVKKVEDRNKFLSSRAEMALLRLEEVT